MMAGPGDQIAAAAGSFPAAHARHGRSAIPAAAATRLARWLHRAKSLKPLKVPNRPRSILKGDRRTW